MPRGGTQQVSGVAKRIHSASRAHLAVVDVRKHLHARFIENVVSRVVLHAVVVERHAKDVQSDDRHHQILE